MLKHIDREAVGFVLLIIGLAICLGIGISIVGLLLVVITSFL